MTDTEQTLKLSSCTKLALSVSCTHGLKVPSVKAYELNMQYYIYIYIYTYIFIYITKY